MTLPVTHPDYWRRRIMETLAREWPIHKTVYNVELGTWLGIQKAHYRILFKLVTAELKLLDAGCGYGGLLDIIPSQRRFNYTGVDISPDFLELAGIRHPTRTFIRADITNLPFADQSFDLAVCRSIQGMVSRNVGHDQWDAMQRELLRVARNLLVLSYSEPAVYSLLPSNPEP